MARPYRRGLTLFGGWSRVGQRHWGLNDNGVSGSTRGYFNDRHDSIGHLFQGRYKAVRQQCDEQLWQVLRYVALNPVQAGVCTDPEDYRWSSYGPTLRNDTRPVALDRVAWFLGAGGDEDARRRYRDLIATRDEHVCQPGRREWSAVSV